MASSSISLVNAQCSYLEWYNCWLKDNRSPNGDSLIPINVILTGLSSSRLLSIYERQLVEGERTNMDKLLKLFTEIMPAKGEAGFNQVVDILRANNSEQMAKDLITKCYGPEIGNTNSIKSPLSKSKGQAQVHLSRLIRKNVDFMSKYWSDVIRVAKTEAAFVQVQVLEHFKSENGNPVNSYREVFDKGENEIQPQILIQADPGCGKTTYVNKLALDWANEDEYLRDKFDFVFLIPLQTLTMDLFDAIKWFLPEQSQSFFSSYAESAESKILLILDGFDELVENSKWYSSVMDILNGKSMQFQFFHLIVTTRRSHVEKIPQQFRERSLLIKGFDQQSMKKYLDKQHVPLPSVGQESNLSHLLQTPLFCAIYCSLHFGRDPIELEDSYDLIKVLIENSVKNPLKKKTVDNEKEQLDEIGKFAFQMLDSKSLNFVKMFCRTSEVIKPSFDLSRVNLDLLIKRRIPLVGINRFKEEFSLPHQLIAEYLAARYFARSLTQEHLKQADASALIRKINYCVLDLPFVRFFLFELIFLYLEKKYKESLFDNFLNIPELRFIWNCKSNTDIQTLNNVSHLDFIGWNSELINPSRFIPTLSKCRHLSSLRLFNCGLSKNQVEQLVNLINNNYFQQLIQLGLGWNENVGSTPQLITALSKCKHLQVLYLEGCNLTVKSTTELATCIDNNGFADLTELQLDWNGNVGLSTELFHVLHKCPQLQGLRLSDCSMTEESMNIFLSTFNSNTFQQLIIIWLWGNEDIKVDDNFFIALEKCPKISEVNLPEYMESDLSEVGRKAKETLEQRGCLFVFD